MKNLFKNFSAVAAICLSVFVLISCGNSNSDLQKKVKVTVEDRISEENPFSVTDEIEVLADLNSGECFRLLCNSNDVEIAGVDDGYITSVNNLESVGDYAWMFFVNGELAEKGVKDIIPADGDEITLAYVNWKELFEEE